MPDPEIVMHLKNISIRFHANSHKAECAAVKDGIVGVMIHIGHDQMRRIDMLLNDMGVTDHAAKTS